jgi:hypothetical protein
VRDKRQLTQSQKPLISAAVAALEVLTAVLLNILILLDVCYVDWCTVIEVCRQLQGTLVPKRVLRNSSAFFVSDAALLKALALLYLLCRKFTVLLLLDPEDGGTTILRNVISYLIVG